MKHVFTSIKTTHMCSQEQAGASLGSAGKAIPCGLAQERHRATERSSRDTGQEGCQRWNPVLEALLIRTQYFFYALIVYDSI